MTMSEQKSPESHLSERDFACLEELIQSEAEPAETLKAAAADYMQQISQGTLQSAYDSAAVLETPAAASLDKVIGIFKDEPLMDALMERITDMGRSPGGTGK